MSVTGLPNLAFMSRGEGALMSSEVLSILETFSCSNISLNSLCRLSDKFSVFFLIANGFFT